MEAYRIEDLARESGTTVRTIRAYQDRGLLPKPERRGRANVYGTAHLDRLGQIAGLLDRGYTLASIKELLEAWDTGTGLGGVLGLVSEMNRPWSDERPARIARAVLTETFGGRDDEAIEEAISLGVLERAPAAGPGEDGEEEFLVPSPQELAVAAELHRAGVPLMAIGAHMRELRGQVEHIAERFMEFTIEYVFARFLDHQPTEAEATEAADLVRRLRPLAQQTVDAELARAMHALSSGMVHLTAGAEPAVPPAAAVSLPALTFTRPPAVTPATSTPAAGTGTAAGQEADRIDVPLPASTVRSVRALVGLRNAAAFITAAAEREVQARAMDALTPDARPAPPR